MIPSVIAIPFPNILVDPRYFRQVYASATNFLERLIAQFLKLPVNRSCDTADVVTFGAEAVSVNSCDGTVVVLLFNPSTSR